MTVYISIPITGLDLYTQRTNAAEVAELISSHGHEPVNPFDSPEPPADLSERERYAYFMGEDIKQLLMCDAILMCAGWPFSKGCRMELSAAYSQRLKIYYSEKEFIRANNGKEEI